MALIYRTYACDSGGDAELHTFEILIERDQHPAFCPLCGAPVDGDPIPAKIAIGGSAATRAVDMTYDLVEQSSIARAQQAEEAGLSPAQARTLKVTDMHDNLREGDVAAKLPQYPNNQVGDFMRKADALGIHYGFTAGSMPGGGQYNGPTTSQTGKAVTGPANDALGAAQGAAGSQHAQTRAQMVAKGQLNVPGS